MKAALQNSDIAHALIQLAEILEPSGENRYKIKAYRTAARNINAYSKPIADLLKSGSDLQEIPGVGKGIASSIEEILKTGTLPQLKGSSGAPAEYLKELADYPGLDPVKVKRAYERLKITSIAGLKEAMESGLLAKKLGARAALHFKNGLSGNRLFLWAAIEPLAESVFRVLERNKAVERVEHAGDYRRKAEVVGELRYVIQTGAFLKVIDDLEKDANISRLKLDSAVTAEGSLLNGAALRLFASDADGFAATLLEATGSTEHLLELQRIGKSAGVSEEALYASLDLQFIEPELREGRGEVEAARKKELPQLIGIQDIRGELHSHSTYSDGANSIEEMVEAAIGLGYEYLSVSDHTRSLKIANGLSEERLIEQIDEIDRIQADYPDFTILKSAEVDILEDGSLDYTNAILKRLDLRVCSIHSKFRLSKEKQTARILRAMENPYFNILGHATGRLLLARDPYELDIEAILEAAAANGCFLEINANPNRLDLSDVHAKLARDCGVKIAVSTDAHSTHELKFMRFGINQARRAWLERDDVLNTLSWTKLKKVLRRDKS